uniref:cilia- and flagella-associated protein 57-like n=1 Tax=Myxine glutinosa TaxID=7769 RepID=UPI00358FA67B
MAKMPFPLWSWGIRVDVPGVPSWLDEATLVLVSGSYCVLYRSLHSTQNFISVVEEGIFNSKSPLVAKLAYFKDKSGSWHTSRTSLAAGILQGQVWQLAYFKDKSGLDIQAVAVCPRQRRVAIGRRMASGHPRFQKTDDGTAPDSGWCIAVHEVSVPTNAGLTQRLRCTIRLPEHSEAIVSVSWSSNGQYLAAVIAAADPQLYVWSWERKKLLGFRKISDALPGPPLQVSINSEGMNDVSVTGPCGLQLYRLPKIGSGLQHLSLPSNLKHCQTSILSHTWLKNHRIAIASKGGEIFIISVEIDRIQLETSVTLPELTSLPSPSLSGTQQFFRPLVAYGQGLACLLSPETVVLFQPIDDSKDYKQMGLVKVPPGCLQDSDGKNKSQIVVSICVSLSGDSLVIATDQKQLYVLHLTPQGGDIGMEPITVTGHVGPVSGLAVCARCPIVASCSLDGHVHVWNYKTRLPETSIVFAEECLSLALHPSGLFFAAGFSDKLRYFSILVDGPCCSRQLPVSACHEVVFSNGGHLISAASENVVQVFCCVTFNCLIHLHGHTGKTYKVQILQELKPNNGPKHIAFALEMLSRIEDEDYLKKVMFTDEACFHISGKVNQHNVRIWGFETPHVVIEHICDSPKINVWCGLLHDCLVSGLAWRQDDQRLGTLSLDGVIFLWNLWQKSEDGAGLQESEAEFKGCCFHSLSVGPAGTQYAVGEVASEAVNVKNKVAPLLQPCGVIVEVVDSQMCVTVDQHYLLTASEDGCIFFWQLEGKNILEMASSPDETEENVADDVLVSHSRLLENEQLLMDLRKQLEEVLSQHSEEFQMRYTMCEEEKQNMTEHFRHEIKNLNKQCQILKMEKEQQQQQFEEEMAEIVDEHMKKVQTFGESPYKKSLMKTLGDAEKARKEIAQVHELCTSQFVEARKKTQQELEEVEQDFQKELQLNIIQHTKDQEMLQQRLQEQEEILHLAEEDKDMEILEIKKNMGLQLKKQQECNIQLKNETELLRMKMAGQPCAQKQQNADKKAFNIEQKGVELQRLEGIEEAHEETIVTLQQNVADHNTTLQDKKRCICDLNKTTQELKEHNSVLECKLRDIENHVKPREVKLLHMQRRMEQLSEELRYSKQQSKEIHTHLQGPQHKLLAIQKQLSAERTKVHDMHSLLTKFGNDLHTSIGYLQQPKVLHAYLEKLHAQYSQHQASPMEPKNDEEEAEHGRKREFLEKSLVSRFHSPASDARSSHIDAKSIFKENVKLLQELSELRKELQVAQRQSMQK